MHVLIAGLYACVIYLSLLAYIIIIGGPLLTFLLASPILISAAIVFIFALDYAVRGVTWALKRWRRAQAN